MKRMRKFRRQARRCWLATRRPGRLQARFNASPYWEWRIADERSGLLDTAVSTACVGIVVPPRSCDQDGALWIERATQANPKLLWIAVIGESQRADPAFMKVVAATCYNFVTTPLEPIAASLPRILGHAAGVARLRSQLLDRPDHNAQVPGMIGNCEPMKRARNLIAKFARVDSPVMIGGESGTGKELVAQAIHQMSARAQGPFVALNCGAIPDNLMETELFGHVKGAFTGAVQDRAGRAELAHGGTLFLDEIGDLPLSHQVKLLRFVQEGCFERVGSSRSTRVDVRIVSATHIDLEAAVKAQTFREDLFYRLNVLQLKVPPLRERGKDVALLAEHFLAQVQHKTPTVANGFSADALVALSAYHWPGNVRELINRVSKAAVMAEATLITPENLGLPDPREPSSGSVVSLFESRERAERIAVAHALRDCGNNVSQAALVLGVSRMTIYRLLEKHDIKLD